ncbi:MAG TPA: GNAT family N-acetyltransferase [Ignavibacteria bacterium]|nr:GNAT family N-acetyltransferase [Ignavibacteria bacterium]HMR41808.1 GNAT family N-acetyltransferase [Ignavibacteria bacterium]
MKILETERLYLREFRLSDTQRMSEIHLEEETMRYIGKGGIRNAEQTKRGIEYFIKNQHENGFSLWALIEKENDTLIGHCGLEYLLDRSDIELCYLLSKDYWGKGYATEISKATLEYGFKNLMLKRIVAMTYPENLPSVNVLKKIGLKPKGEKEFFGIRFLFFSCLDRDLE